MKFFLMNMKYAWRTARRSPGITLIILLLLTLGTGGVTVVFNPIYSLIFATPPFPQADRLVLINSNIPLYDGAANEIVKNNTLEYLFSNIASYTVKQEINNLTYDKTEEYKTVRYIYVTEDFFRTLGVQPWYGNDFEHGKRGNIISNHFWRNELNGDPDVIGKPIRRGSAYIFITGVMPDTFDFPIKTDLWIYNERGYLPGDRHFIGRLNPGISIEQAVRELKAAKFETQTEFDFGGTPILKPFNAVFYDDIHTLLLMLSATSVLFLLLVCSGIMSILVTRGIRRKSELGLRLTLGATRWNLIFQLIQETLPLIIIGTIAGMWLSEIVGTWLHVQYPMLKGGEVVVSVKMVFFTAMVLIVSIISSFIPAFYCSSVNLNMSLKSDTYSKQKIFSLHELLIGAQLGLTLTFLICAGLLLRGMMSKVEFPIGWNPQTVFVVDGVSPIRTFLNLSEHITEIETVRKEFRHQLEIMPEVASVGVIYPIPFSAEAVMLSQMSLPVFKNPNGRYSMNPDGDSSTIQGDASPEVFKMLGINLIAGRYFNQTDVANEFNYTRELWESGRTANTDRVVIINQSLAKKLWPGENAVGKILYNWYSDPCEVVGIVNDFYQVADNKTIHPTLYYPATSLGVGSYLVKLKSNSLTQSFQRGLRQLNTRLSYIHVQSLSKVVSDSTASMRLLLQLFGVFSLLGIVLAGLGVYATAKLMEESRTRETGIRMSMGAQTWDILRLTLWRGIRAILIGLPLGLFLAWILSRILSSFIFQLNAADALVWVVSCVFLVGIVIIAALIPAIRATRVNPADVLRNE